MALIKRTAVVASWTLGSRVLGLLRDRLLAGAFGGTLLLDGFLLAFALPNLFRNLFGEGALSAAFVPRYVQMRDADAGKADAFAGLVITRLALLLGSVAAGGMVLGAWLSVSGGPELALVAALTVPQLPYLIFICCAAIMAGTLNGRRHFAIPAAAPVLLNLVLIAAILLWRDVWLLPYAVLVAGAIQLAAHLAALLTTTGGVPRATVRSGPELRELRGALLPVLFATGVHQLNALLDSVIAYALIPGAGAVAYLYFGNRLFLFPMALVAHGVGTAVYPELSSAAGKGWEASGAALRQASGLILAMLLPAAVGLLLVAEPLVRTVYQNGQFGEDAVARTTLVTQLYAFALLPAALSKLFVRIFHAHRQQRVPVQVGVAMVALNLALNITLVLFTPLEEAALALATACSSLLSVLCFMVLLRRRGVGAILAPGLLGRPLLACLLMGAGVAALLWYWRIAPDAGTGAHALRLGAAVLLGAGIYLPLAWRSLRP